MVRLSIPKPTFTNLYFILKSNSNASANICTDGKVEQRISHATRTTNFITHNRSIPLRESMIYKTRWRRRSYRFFHPYLLFYNDRTVRLSI